MIVEIALGIVLAVLILAYLPILLGGGIILIVGVLLIVAVYFIGNSPTMLSLVMLAGIGYILYDAFSERISESLEIRSLKDQIKKRSALGYDTSILNDSLEKALSKASKKMDTKWQMKS